MAVVYVENATRCVDLPAEVATPYGHLLELFGGYAVPGLEMLTTDVVRVTLLPLGPPTSTTGDAVTSLSVLGCFARNPVRILGGVLVTVNALGLVSVV
tara:strand:- start:151 stop:444 length:294 start_codon:yes stop_codon:yes gene_type:complete